MSHVEQIKPSRAHLPVCRATSFVQSIAAAADQKVKEMLTPRQTSPLRDRRLQIAYHRVIRPHLDTARLDGMADKALAMAAADASTCFLVSCV